MQADVTIAAIMGVDPILFSRPQSQALATLCEGGAALADSALAATSVAGYTLVGAAGIGAVGVAAGIGSSY